MQRRYALPRLVLAALSSLLLASCGGGSGGDTAQAVRKSVTPACWRTLRSNGAIGDGLTDDTAAVQAALNGSCGVDGENLPYAVSGSLEIGGIGTLQNAAFRQRGVAPNLRTLMKDGGTITLRNVKVDRGREERNGAFGDSAGVFLNGTADALLEDVEVTGDGYGAGIWVNASTRTTLLRPYVHDMHWSTAMPPAQEQVLGIWINASTQVTIRSGRVQNLLGESGSNVYSSWQSDGISVGGTSGLFIIDTVVENTGEGIDITGSAGNQDFEIAHSSVFDSDSVGFKVANFNHRGVIRDSVAVRAGLAGFVVSGPSENLPLEGSSDITIIRAKALNTGYNQKWADAPVAGFRVMPHNYQVSYPKRVRVLDSQAVDDQPVHTMKYGFLSDPGVGPNGNFNVDSTGHLIDGGSGFQAAQYGFDFIQQNAQQILGCQLKQPVVDWLFDRSYIDGWTRERLIADLEDDTRRALQPSLCQ